MDELAQMALLNIADKFIEHISECDQIDAYDEVDAAYALSWWESVTGRKHDRHDEYAQVPREI